jgi:hypothetical protein
MRRNGIGIVGLDLMLNLELPDGVRVMHDFAPWLRSSGSIDQDMEESASKIAWAGSALGQVEACIIRLDSEYRTWRADETENLLSVNDKMSEWKVKSLIEGHPKFTEFKKRIAELEGLKAKMRAVVFAFGNQADTLRSRGANLRAEMKAHGMSTPVDPADEDEPIYGGNNDRSERTDRDREDAIRSALSRD